MGSRQRYVRCLGGYSKWIFGRARVRGFGFTLTRTTSRLSLSTSRAGRTPLTAGILCGEFHREARPRVVLGEATARPANIGVPQKRMAGSLGSVDKFHMPRLLLKRPRAGRERGAKPTVEWTSVKAEQRCQGRCFDRGLGRRIFDEGLSFLFVPSSPRRNPNPP